MKWICFAFFLLTAVSGISQNDSGRIDREQVKKLVADSAAPTYYPKLLARFNSFDTTLTAAEYRLLYYGFVFQLSYSPYGDDKKGEILKLMQAKSYADSIKTCDTALAKTPISLV